MNELPDILHEVFGLLEQARLDHMFVGSLAVSVHGDPRATRDVDVVVALPFDEREKVSRLLDTKKWPWEAWEDPLWGKRLMSRHPSGMRIEVFFAARHEVFDREFSRRIWIDYEGKRLPFLSPEDLVLRKLVNTRIRKGNDYDDALGVILSQGDSLDKGYIRGHCAVHRVCELFEHALREAATLKGRSEEGRKGPS